MSKPTPKEDEFLDVCYKYYCKYSDFPDTQTLKSALKVKKSRISYLKGQLKQNDFLRDTKSIFFTEKAFHYMRDKHSYQDKVVELSSSPTYLPLLGEVRAGETSSDELVAYVDDFAEAGNAPMEPIPYASPQKDTFLLKVVGQSMERENILEEDLLIAQKIEKANVRDGELIVTKYLPWSYKDVLSEIPADELLSEYKGPVVKYCTVHQQVTGNNEMMFYRLGWRKDIHSSAKYNPMVSDIEPIAKVIGLYRRIN